MNQTSFKKISDYKELIKKEVLLFKQDYNAFFKINQSKPKKIGKPFLLKNKISNTGILLIHGLMAAPEEVREIGEIFHSKGYSVYAPRLAGHGTSPKDLSSKKYSDWIESVDKGYEVIKNICDKVIIAGFSTGGGIALHQALTKPEKFEAVISISAPLKFKGFSFHFTEIVNYWNLLAQKKGINKFKKIYVTNHPDNPHINYTSCPVSSIKEVRALMKKVYKSLPMLSIPSLIIQAKDDPKVDGKSGRKIFAKIKNKYKQYQEIDFNKHGIVRGKIKNKVYEGIDKFLNSILS
jgi:carboxylesterase